tara:strand:- start:351 stop:620 length:270 start_codon:yes stop_codon:yes gene_type:complete
MRDKEIKPHLKKILKKLSKKNKKAYEIILSKISEILNCEDVEHYKNLRKPLQHLKSVHIKSSFVLTFNYIKSENKIIFCDFDHHDNIYK